MDAIYSANDTNGVRLVYKGLVMKKKGKNWIKESDRSIIKNYKILANRIA